MGLSYPGDFPLPTKTSGVRAIGFLLHKEHQLGNIKVDPRLRVDRKLENQQNGRMKTTFDIPDALVKQLKLRALHKGQKLKDAVAEVLRKGLACADAEAVAPVVSKDRKTGLPRIECKNAARPDEEITPERVAEILLAQEAGWQHAAAR